MTTDTNSAPAAQYVVANPRGLPDGIQVISLDRPDGEPALFVAGDAFDPALVSADILAEFIAEGVIVGASAVAPVAADAASTEGADVEI